jgi:glucan phosphorylase
VILVDERGSDRGIAIQHRGYAPCGITAVQVKRFHRGKRVHMLPAYTIDGIIYYNVYHENVDTWRFEDFIGGYRGPDRNK